MIFGAHVIVYSQDADADRAFPRDVLGFQGVDAGHDQPRHPMAIAGPAA